MILNVYRIICAGYKVLIFNGIGAINTFIGELLQKTIKTSKADSARWNHFCLLFFHICF